MTLDVIFFLLSVMSLSCTSFMNGDTRRVKGVRGNNEDDKSGLGL